eukprot:scaffold138699_cov31-Tisochrysis_lutea.AAC.3
MPGGSPSGEEPGGRPGGGVGTSPGMPTAPPMGATYPDGRAIFISRPHKLMPLKSSSAVVQRASDENSTKAN